jgi:diguanylate cyclase (GGDEF)-like protein
VPGRDEVSIVIKKFDLMREKLQYFYNDMAREAREQREQREQAEAIAGTDELTRLFNRRAFYEFLGHRIEEAEQGQTPLGVVYFDLNGFKPINDMHGHALGDYVLQTVGRRLIATTREGDFAARVGGDEFAVVLTAVTDADAAEEAGWRLVQTVSEAIAYEELDLSVGVSAGIALYPAHGGTPQELVEHADQAMYKAKSSLGADRTATGSALRVFA